MKHLTEYRDPQFLKNVIQRIEKITTRKWYLMEICGGQTHAIKRYGLDQLLPSEIELIHGPGCPVCVTSLELIDKAIAIASLPNVIFTSYGDMLRVPGTKMDLLSVRAAGGDVRIIYTPLDAVKIAQENPSKEVVFFAIGFETTAPANALNVIQAESQKLKNFSMLVSHVRIPPAIEIILSSPEKRVDAFLAAGHVCAIMGYWEYKPIAEKYRTPIVVTGFEPLDILQGIFMAIQQLEAGQFRVANAYRRVVTYKGNQAAQKVIQNTYVECDRKWRGIGEIKKSGWALNSRYSQYDAEKRFEVSEIRSQESLVCIAGQILQGLKKPNDCPAFKLHCTPEHPLGATMVSNEGACSAYFRYS